MTSPPPDERFAVQTACWICGGRDLAPVASLVFELDEYRRQDPELAALTGTTLRLDRCRACGFAQPAALPVLPRYFDRMYDQRWSADWIRAEHETTVKDVIFDGILAALESRLPGDRRRLLDVGAHAGRFVARALARGWRAEGLELNPQTRAYAAERTGARVRQMNVADLDPSLETFDAITITDVLEHVPFPLSILERLHALLNPGGWLAVKVPSGPAQVLKERWRGRLNSRYRPTVADNLVHVSHFSSAALQLALSKSGFTRVSVRPGAPELPEGQRLSRLVRLGLFGVARALPGGAHLPISLNLQAYAQRP